jgi:hypothetical protein
MRRALLALAVTACTILALTWSASVASAQVITHFRFSGNSAEADWATSTATSFTDTLVTVSTSKNQGSELFVDRFTAHFAANGNFTGATDTTAEVTRGFSFTLGHRLASARLSGSGLSATTCTFDANFDQTGCRATTIGVTVTWTGQGPIGRGVSNEHFKFGGFRVNDHLNGTFRDATATGTVAGHTLRASQLQFADLATTKSGTTTVCIGNAC